MGVVAHQRLLAASAAAVLAIVTVSCSQPASQSAAPVRESPAQKPDFTQIDESMLIDDASAVPDISAEDFTGPVLNSDGHNPNDDQVDPPECAPILSGPAHAQKGVVLWSTTETEGSYTNTTGKDIYVNLEVPTGRPDLQGLRDLLGKCGTFQGDGLTYTVSPLQHPGLPDSAVAWRSTAQDSDGKGGAGAEIIGLYRGLYVEAGILQWNGGEPSPGDIDVLVKLFDDQMTKLQAI